MTAHLESSAALPATPTEVFAYVDDPTHLAAHMAKPSWTMAGGYMNLVLDEMRGREAGARIRLAGRVLGVPLEVDELVVERTPPRRKVWQTVGTPRLFLIGSYRMGFDVAPRADGSLLRVFIDYDLPATLLGRWLGKVFGHVYARWCTARMVRDAGRHFAQFKEKP